MRKFYGISNQCETIAQTSIPSLTLNNDMPCLDCNCLCH